MSDYLKSWRENVTDNRTYEGGMLPEAEVFGSQLLNNEDEE